MRVVNEGRCDKLASVVSICLDIGSSHLPMESRYGREAVERRVVGVGGVGAANCECGYHLRPTTTCRDKNKLNRLSS